MEVKVWVDGIQRVVCGATMETTCQDVVIALAHAMGRTGRFTLIERWRDNDRPLTPAECPLQVLHKWGEYAAEVRFVLCQADSEHKKLASQERLVRRGMGKSVSDHTVGEKSASSHRVLSPQIQSMGGEASVKRSLTFSGAHNQPVGESTWLNSSAPNSKFRKTHLGPVPNGEVRHVAGLHYGPHSSIHSLPRQAGNVGEGGGPQTTAPSSLQSSQQHPHHRHSSPARPQQGKDSGPSGPASPSLSSSLSHPFGNANRRSAFQPPQPLHSRQVSPSKSSSGPEGSGHPAPHSQSRLQPQSGFFPQASSASQSQSQQSHPRTSAAHLQAGELPHPQTRPQPHSPQGHVQQQSKPAYPSSHHNTPHSGHHPHAITAMSLTTSVPSSQATIYSNVTSDQIHKTSTSAFTANCGHSVGLQIEEYNLDYNFPNSHKDWNHNDQPSDSLEYRLEEALGSSGSGSVAGSQVEGEHAKLLRLVNMQQQHLKTQESQISVINTEISSLEEKEMEYEENLHVIMEELLLQENRQRELEPQLNELEKVDWETVLEDEKKCEIDLTLKVASYKAMIIENQHKLEDMKTHESELFGELKKEEENISQEREHLKKEEDRAKEEAGKTKEEISKLQVQLSDLQKSSEECDTSLTCVDSELTSVEKDLGEKTEVLKQLEADLKEENLKDFGAHPVPELDLKDKDGQQVLRKILEDSLSPRLTVNFHSQGPDNTPPAGPSLLAAFATANQSGVWV